MFKTTFAFLLLLILLPSMINAQTPEPAPWPPDPTAIFAPGVEVVSVEVEAPREYNPPTYDNKTRIVRVWDDANQRWQEFPYPDEVQNFEYIMPRTPTHMIDLNTKLGGPYGTSPLPEGQWSLDTDTSEYARPELACGELRDKAGHGHWTVKTDDKGKSFFLCDTATKENIGLIPLHKWDYLQNTSTSPDGKHVVIFGNSGRVYSYTFATNSLIDLGSSQGTYIQWAMWIDNQRVFIYTTDEADMSYPWRNYYLANVTKPGSLKWITTAIKPNEITSLDNHHRTQWITHADDKCLFTELNWETAQITDYNLDGLCTEGTIIPDGTNDRLYFEYDWPDDAFDMGMAVKQPRSSMLVRFNPFTGKRTDLLKGEVEWVEDISPDGLYAVVVTDDDGCFEAYPREDPYDHLPPCESKQESKPQQVLINLKTGDKLYQQPTEWSASLDGDFWYACYDKDTKTFQNEARCVATLSAGPSDSWTFIDDHLLFQVAYPDNNVEYSLINLRGNKRQKQVIGLADELRYLPASQQFLVTQWLPTKTQLVTNWSLYDMQTRRLTPFIDKFVDQYTINFGDDTVDTITITLSPPNQQWVNGRSDSVERYVYTVRFPTVKQ